MPDELPRANPKEVSEVADQMSLIDKAMILVTDDLNEAGGAPPPTR